MLLCHPNGFCADVWSHACGILRKNSFKCAAIDLLGHGDAPPFNSSRPDWTELAEHVADATMMMQSFRLVGVGHSLGAASILAAELLRPGTFERIVLYEPILIPPSQAPLAVKPSTRQTHFASVDVLKEYLLSKALFAQLHPEPRAGYITGGFHVHPNGALSLKCDPSTENGIFALGGWPDDLWKKLAQVC